MTGVSEPAKTMKTQRRCVWAAVISVPLLLSPRFAALPAGAAESSGSAALSARLAADRAVEARQERQMSAERAKIDGMQVADLFGPSDEEKAAAAQAAQREQDQDSNIATLSQRVHDLEESQRKLTGEIEVLNHRLDEIDQHIERVRKEFDYKLCFLSAQELGAQASSGSQATGGNALPCNPSTGALTPPAQSAPPPQQQAATMGQNTMGQITTGQTTMGQTTVGQSPGNGVAHLAPSPGTLGTLPESAPGASPPGGANAAAAQAGTATQSASLDPRAQYQAAMKMLAKSQYDEASGAFRAFVEANPKDPLAPQALYWLGDIAYVQKDYPSAARAFVEELKTYPTSSRGAESMLKLGQSLLAMNQKREGCTTLHALRGRYPTASKSVLNQAEAVSRAGGCRRH